MDPEAITHDSSPSVDPLRRPLLDAVRRAQREFLGTLQPLRPALHGYCLRLTGNLWDAEDLVQETLTRAFARAAETADEIRRPLAWLLRIATNAFLDSRRRPPPVPAPIPDRPEAVRADPLEVRDALAALAVLLPPQERAAIVLKEAFDLPLAEIAAMLDTSVGAVKSALHRGRDKLAEPPPSPRREAPDRAVLDELAAAFTAYDLDRLAALFRAESLSEIVGVRREWGAGEIREGSLRHTLTMETDVRYRAAVVDLDGETVVALWETPVGERAVGGSEGLGDLLRLDVADGAVSRLRWYYFCPETLTAAAARLGGPVRTHGYGY